MGLYIQQDFILAMGNISVVRKCLPIPNDHYFSEAQRKLADTVYDNLAPKIIGECSVAGVV